MKALLIADNQTVIDNIGTVLKSAGYDIITYRYFLKALDNIEEISPHLIVISTQDYPRHWKTLAQFSTTNFGGYIPEIILFTGNDFSEEEKKKAKALNVRGTFKSVDVEGLDCLREILLKKTDIYSGTLTLDDLKSSGENKEEVPTVEDLIGGEIEEELNTEDLIREKFDLSYQLEKAETKAQNCSLVMLNPVTKALITGDCSNYTGDTVEFTADITAHIKGIEQYTIIDGSIKINEKLEKVLLETAQKKDNKLILKIKSTL